MKSPRLLSAVLSAALPAALLATCLAADAAALLAPQAGPPPWNRRTDALAMVPSPSGLPGHFDVSVVWTVVLGQPTSMTLNLGTEVGFEIDGHEVARVPVSMAAFALSGQCGSCAPGCGAGATNGMAAALLCLSDGPAGCSCQFPPITSTLPDVPLSPGAVIAAVLHPAPGAAPEFMPGDDKKVEKFLGPSYWDRRAQSASLKPTASGPPGTWDLHVDWGASTAGTKEAKLITPEFVVYKNGFEDFVYESPCGPWIIAPNNTCFSCVGQVCGTITCNGVVQSTSTCQESPNGAHCACYSSSAGMVIIPGLVLAPGDVVEVLLKAAPGALPELPVLDDDQSVFVAVPWSPWKNLEKALPGVAGSPVFAGSGTLVAGTPVSLALSSARPLAPAWLVAGPFTAFKPFKGGVMVPDPAPPALVFPSGTTAAGTLNLVGPWPAGVPAGFTLFMQWWIADAAGPQGFAASNALSATTEP
jgi:hypothetical protein